MHSYIDLYFSSESVSPLEIAERLRQTAGLSFIIGPHDLAFEWSSEAEFRDRLSKVHAALKGTEVFYRIETAADEPGFIEPVPWPPPLPRSPTTHPGY